MKSTPETIKLRLNNIVQSTHLNWLKLSYRDRVALSLLCSFLFIIFSYNILSEVAGFNREAKNHYLEAQEEYQWLKAQEPLIKDTSSSETNFTSGQTVLSLITQSAKQHDLSLKRVQPEGDEKIRVWLESSPSNKALDWLEDLAEKGIKIDDISIETIENQLGFIQLRSTLSRH